MAERVRNFYQEFYKKWHLQIVIVGIVCGILACIFLSVRMMHRASLQEGIAKEIIRFHVIANSDTDEDQALKMHVKNEVVEYMEGLLADSHSIEDTRACIQNNLSGIREKAEEVIREEGYAYPVQAGLANCYFPIKSYGDITFPAGDYEALRIQIGESRGKNWWCVLYPNLCFIDSIHAVVPEDEKEELKEVLTEDEYDSLFAGNKKEVRISWKFWPFGK